MSICSIVNILLMNAGPSFWEVNFKLCSYIVITCLLFRILLLPRERYHYNSNSFHSVWIFFVFLIPITVNYTILMFHNTLEGFLGKLTRTKRKASVLFLSNLHNSVAHLLETMISFIPEPKYIFPTVLVTHCFFFKQ